MGGQGSGLSKPSCGQLPSPPHCHPNLSREPGKQGQGPWRSKQRRGGNRSGHKNVPRRIQILTNQNWPQAPPLPGRARLAKAGLTQSALSKTCWAPPRSPASTPRAASRGYSGERTGVPIAGSPAKPRAREQKSRMRHWTQVPAGPGAAVRRSWEGHRPEAPMLPAALRHPGLAASLSLQPSGHPDSPTNMAWETDPP